MQPRQFIYPDSDDDAICLAQTAAGAGSLVINGALLDLPATMQDVRRAILGAGIERVVTLTSAGDLSGIDFTITGLDTKRRVVTETIAGPNANTVPTAVLFMTVTDVEVNGAVGTAVSVGTGAVGRTRWYKTDHFMKPANITVALAISGTADVTVQDTPDDVDKVDAPTTFDHPVLAGVSASAQSNYAFPARAIRGVMNSGSGGFTLTITQAGW